jgi:hypothetical protein
MIDEDVFKRMVITMIYAQFSNSPFKDSRELRMQFLKAMKDASNEMIDKELEGR